MYLLTERKKLKKQSYLISCHSLGKRFSHWSLKLKFSSEKTFLVKSQFKQAKIMHDNTMYFYHELTLTDGRTEFTVPIDRILIVKNARAWVSHGFHIR